MSVFNQVGGSEYVSCVQQAGDDQSAIAQCQQDFEGRLEGQLDQDGN
ncbi:hypothetical protein [Pseudonocardia sp. ICBG601]|nr:hypothetical protein [Pseudonocardia sp. ICBG601]